MQGRARRRELWKQREHGSGWRGDPGQSPQLLWLPVSLLWKWRSYYSPLGIARKMNWDNVGQNAHLRALRENSESVAITTLSFQKKKKKKLFQMMTNFKAVHWENMFSLNRENWQPRSPGTLTSTLYLNLILWQVTSLCAQKTCVARISPTSRVSFSMNHSSWGNSSTVFMGKAEARAEDSHGT